MNMTDFDEEVHSECCTCCFEWPKADRRAKAAEARAQEAEGKLADLYDRLHGGDGPTPACTCDCHMIPGVMSCERCWLTGRHSK